MAPTPLSAEVVVARVSGVMGGGFSEDDFHRLPSMRPDADFVSLVLLGWPPWYSHDFSLLSAYRFLPNHCQGKLALV